MLPVQTTADVELTLASHLKKKLDGKHAKTVSLTCSKSRGEPDWPAHSSPDRDRFFGSNFCSRSRMIAHDSAK